MTAQIDCVGVGLVAGSNASHYFIGRGDLYYRPRHDDFDKSMQYLCATRQQAWLALSRSFKYSGGDRSAPGLVRPHRSLQREQ